MRVKELNIKLVNYSVYYCIYVTWKKSVNWKKNTHQLLALRFSSINTCTRHIKKIYRDTSKYDVDDDGRDSATTWGMTIRTISFCVCKVKINYCYPNSFPFLFSLRSNGEHVRGWNSYSMKILPNFDFDWLKKNLNMNGKI